MGAFRHIAWLALVAIVATPVAAAQGETWYYGGDLHPTQAAYVLRDEPLQSTVDRSVAISSTATYWARPEPLAVAAPISDGVFEFDLYFTTDGDQTVTVRFGYFDTTGFHPVAVAESVEIITDTAGTALTSDDVHSASGQPTLLPGHTDLPADSYPAIQITTTGENGLYLNTGLLTMRPASSSTIPLPELPAWVLLGSGLAVVAGIAVHRRPRSP